MNERIKLEVFKLDRPGRFQIEVQEWMESRHIGPRNYHMTSTIVLDKGGESVFDRKEICLVYINDPLLAVEFKLAFSDALVAG
jgi:hypothetical protein